jgi:hypothetical protein
MILRIFPRKTNATPNDENVRFGEPGLFDQADEIHISVTFTWDKMKAEYLAGQWQRIAPVKIGGPGIGMRGGEFEPGMYLKKGYVITSRGCPNKCWFCDAWKRDGDVRELEIREGWNVLDDNLFACSDSHIKNVFEMLKRQDHKIEFTGGLEAKRLKGWYIDELLKLDMKQMFFAYDTPDDYLPLRQSSTMLREAGLIRKTSHVARCYVLIGYPKDTFEKAEKRLRDVINLGFMPMAMLYRNHEGKYDLNWRRFQREWANPTIIGTKL